MNQQRGRQVEKYKPRLAAQLQEGETWTVGIKVLCVPGTGTMEIGLKSPGSLRASRLDSHFHG
jgi:hypothetical protein